MTGVRAGGALRAGSARADTFWRVGIPAALGGAASGPVVGEHAVRVAQTKADERADRSQQDGRQIVICCDGTSNTLSAGVRDTNVVRLVEMLADKQDEADAVARAAVDDPGGAPEQVVYYDPGVGVPIGLPPTGVTGAIIEPLRRQLGLALGRGIYENIGEAYLFLSREYGRYAQEDEATNDEIFVFGFSRGAFTASCVAGMVNLFGLVRAEHEHLLPMLLNVYFASPDPPLRVRLVRRLRRQVLGRTAAVEREEIARQVRELFTTASGAAARVHFLGLWDTVQAVGVPGLRRKISSTRSLGGKRIDHVRHALSIDEHRYQFLPRYLSGPLDEHQTLKQLWFRGVHSDVGGGRRSLLSDATFAWMVHEAKEQGLANTGRPDHRAQRVLDNWPSDDPVLGDQLYATPWWSITGMAVRDPAAAWSGEGSWTSEAPLTDPAPLEHDSVTAYSPREGEHRGPTMVAGLMSPWERGRQIATAKDGIPRSPRRWWATLVWAVLGLLGTTLAGVVVDAGPAANGEFPLWTGVKLEFAQVQAIALQGPLVDPHGLAGPTWPDPGWALLASIVPLAGWSYVLARLATRWFARVGLWRRVGGPQPRLERVVWLRGLGFTVSAFVIGGAASILLALVATAFDAGLVRNILLVLSGVGAVLKWIGVFGAGVLGLVALDARWGSGLR